MNDQSDFQSLGRVPQVDYRDSEIGPRSGGNYVVRYDDYQDQTWGRALVPPNRRRSAAVYFVFQQAPRDCPARATVFTYPDSGQTVPFYMQQVLGGSDDLRGYRPYRFYGDHMLLVNAEYRWEVFSGLDMAIFADAGKVAMRRAEIKFKDLESAVGFGFRFNARNATFIRLDFGFSARRLHDVAEIRRPVCPRRPHGASTPSFIR